MAAFTYVISTRRVSKGRFVPEPGDVLYLKVPASAATTTPGMAVEEKQWVLEVRALAGTRASGILSPEGDVLVFVHGYNNDPEIVLKRQRRLQQDLTGEAWRGLVVSFDWPSDNSTLNYIEDRSDASQVAVQMVTKGILVLARGQASGCKTNIHVVGHSTGAYVILEAFAEAQKMGELFKSDWRIAQIAFIGGDVSAKSIAADSQWASPMYDRIMRLTNYSNPFDQVLAVSNAKRLGTAPRAGRVGLPENRHPKSVDVGCGAYFATLDPKKQTFYGTFNHSWHIGNRVFARDLAMTLEGAIDRHAIPTRDHRDGRLVLQDRPRPEFQARWQLESGARG